MKSIIFIFVILLCITHAKAQLTVDAGNDIVLCFSDLSTSSAQLGGNPTASGGVEPYIYTWSGKLPINYSEDSTKWVYASYFLNDTTKSNPTFKMGKIPFDWPVFSLKVEDALGNVQYDSIKIIDGSIFILNNYMLPVTIKKGDSVQFYGDRSFYANYKFLPFELSFVPTYGLSDPTDLYCWAKPDTSTTYYLQAINSVDCVAKTYYWRIEVDTVTASTSEVVRQSVQCYLSHGDLVIKLNQNLNETYRVTVATANGAVIHSGEYTNRNLRLSNLNLKKNQVYLVSINAGNEKQTFKLIEN